MRMENQQLFAKMVRVCGVYSSPVLISLGPTKRPGTHTHTVSDVDIKCCSYFRATLDCFWYEFPVS